MKRKPIKIDWHEIEAAFDNRREDLVYYLDLVTGQVVLEGEGEEQGFDGDDDLLDDDVPDDAPAREATTRLYIEPPGEDEELGWMEDFVDEAKDLDAEFREQLEQALTDERPLDAFREVLRGHPTERDRWFFYRTDRLHETVDAWLDANRVHAAEPPPWR
jgi:DNA-dependent RNA polymerase auxiliary subunit epsilon